MPLVNAFGALSLEATQLAVLAELQQKLEPGQSIVVSSVSGTVTVTGTVALDAPTLAALETVNVNQSGSWTVTITDGGGSITVDGVVDLSAATLAALETINAAQSGTWSVNIGTMPEVEIKNDVGNPVIVRDMNKLVPLQYDFIDLNYTGTDITQVLYKTGGSGGTLVATLTLTYSAPGVLDTVTRT